MKNEVVQNKSKKFALRIVKLGQYLTIQRKEFIITKQVVRSGTSIGANVAEAECAFSEKDFLAKMYIAYKETAETIYWLDLLFESGYITNRQYSSLMNDCEELKKLLSSITKTMRENTE
jgi:four helix bundle protein